MPIIVNQPITGTQTALQIMQQFAGRTGLRVPSYIQSNPDAQVVQLLGLMNEEIDDLASRYSWSQLQTEATFLSTGAESQGSIDVIAPGMKNIIRDTLWSLTKRLAAMGSITPQTTQLIKSLGNPSAATLYRLVRNELHFIPGTNIAAGALYRFEYNSRYAILDAATGLAKQYFEKDADTPRLPASLILLGLRWRWKAAKGLNYSENFSLYEEKVKQAYIDAKDAAPISMYPREDVRPGIVIPQGSWNR